MTDTLPAGWIFMPFTENGSDYFIIYEGVKLDPSGVNATGAPLDPSPVSFELGEDTDGNETASFEFNALNQPYIILVKAGPTTGKFENYLSENNKTTLVQNKLKLETEEWKNLDPVSQDVSFFSEVLGKVAERKESGVVKWTIDYKPFDLELTDSQGLIDGVYIADSLPEGLELRVDSQGNLLLEDPDDSNKKYIEIFKLNMNPQGEYVEGESIPLVLGHNVSYDNENKVLKFEIPDSKQAYRFTYITVITAEPGTITNDVTLFGVVLDEVEKKAEFEISTQDGGASYKMGGLIKIVKQDGFGEPLTGVKFTLYSEDDDGTVIRQGTSGNDGVVIFKAIPVGKYILRETEAPDGYRPDERTYRVEVKKVENGIITTIEWDGGVQTIEWENNQLQGQLTVQNFIIGTTGDLTLSKTVDGDAKELEREFEFTITFEGEEFIGRSFSYYGVGVPDGQIASGDTVRLKDGQRITIVGIPKNAKYTITESDYSNDGYLQTEAQSGTIIVDETQSAAFRNIRNYQTWVEFYKENPDGERLSGGLFGIYYSEDEKFDNPVVDFVPADENGVVRFENLPPLGNYKIREELAPPGYALSGLVIEDVELRYSDSEDEHGIAIELPFINDYDGKITIKKRGASGALKDVTFELLQTLEGSTDPTYVVVGTKTTDEDGIVEFTGLPLGTYYVRETAAPSGYHLNTTLHEVVLTDDVGPELGNDDEPINGWEQTLELRNYLLTDSVILTKTDPNGVALDGGWFGIFSNEEATGDPLDKVQADGGQIVFSGLLPGTYYVRELEAPAGYIKSDKIIKVGVSVSGNSIAGEVVKEPLVNTWAGGIKLVKVDEKGEPLAGAVFELLDANKKVIKEGTSGKDGVIEFKELAMGTYYLREKTAPAGYAKLMELTEVVLKAGAEADMVKTVKLANHRNLASVTLRKTNQYDGVVSGGLFGIYKTDDTGFKNPLQKVASVKGMIIFTDLEAGQYFIREIEAPKHHKLTGEFVKVVLEVNPDTGLLEDVEIEEPLLNETPLTEEEWDEKVEGDEDDKDNGEKDDDLVETGSFLDTAMLWFFGTLLILAGAILLLRMRAALVRK